MSSKANKLEKQAIRHDMPEQETKELCYRIDVKLNGCTDKSCYMVVTGVPKDLPIEYESTIKSVAQQQFAQALNERTFLEFYTLGKTSKDENPVFYNIENLVQIQVIDVCKLD